MTTPRVSVVMPVFNSDRYLRQAIESILEQSLGDFEFLIYDDGSTDQSVAIAREYEKCDSRIQLMAGEHRGYVAWLNEGIRQAKAPLIARMDSDDIALPERFQRQVAFIESNPQCVVVGTDYAAIDEDDELLIINRHATVHSELVRELLQGEVGVICHPSAMMRRDVCKSIGGYRGQYETIEDHDLWFRLASVGELANIPEVLMHYRLHDRSVCHAQSQRQKAILDEVVNLGRASFGLPPLTMTVWPSGNGSVYERRLIWALCALISDSRHAARKHALAAVRLKPYGLKAWMVLAALCLSPKNIDTLRRLKRLRFASASRTLRE